MRIATLFLGLLVAATVLLWAGVEGTQERADPLAAMGMKVSEGAAAGYVEDRACGICHRQIFDSYQEVGMARSFMRPRREESIEDFSQPFHHVPSDRYYQMSWNGERLVFRRYQRDAQGQPINEIEIPVDWILGSGHTSRTYLFRTGSGELYQFPLAWYSQTSSWGMAPGYDRPRHLGLQRLVRRECMFCHNAYPDVEEGSDQDEQMHVFPATLPEGTGCQRCHGPGAGHARKALRGEATESLRTAIVNPGRLEPARRDEICYGCHLQPSVGLPGIRRFERGTYSFRPGQKLSDYQVLFDIEEEGNPRSERFEINHHPYRLRQSACFLEGQGKLSCLTCHDPHRKVPAAQRAAHYREACLSCHSGDEMASLEGHACSFASLEQADCVSCHMPRRRTQDVIQVVMTDHRIQRRPAPQQERLAPLQEATHTVSDVDFYRPEHAPPGNEGQVYRAAAVLKTGTRASDAFLDQYQKLLGITDPSHAQPFLQAVPEFLRRGQFEQARQLISAAQEKDPGNVQALGLQGALEGRAGNLEEAITKLRQALEAQPGDCRFRYNLGRFLRAADRPQEAVTQLRLATVSCSNLAIAYLHLGFALEETEQAEEAIAAYRRGLAVDPSLERLYLALAEVLAAQDQKVEASRYLSHAARILSESPQLTEAAKKLGGQDN
ncbi:MAG TPA: tetratricopeptide repeat protein [Acidobacteriota bacterium]|nr:tetratricopeptide repeat protein [Acidobacteriota bacterium]